jgi:glutathionyl-hydroquinone reductase
MPDTVVTHADKDGHFRRRESSFRNFVSRDPNSTFPAEANRYALYVNVGCPWAHRTILTRSLKSLDSIIQLIKTDFVLTEDGWLFTGRNGSDPVDPLYGFTSLSQLYYKADPEYVGRFTVPVLWDKQNETIVNNESSEIIRMLYSAFDGLLPEELREENRPGGGFYPEHLRKEIDEMNEWVYNTVNNGVYKCGFAATQEAYDANIYPLFASLDRLEEHLGEPGHSPFLFGPYVTEADIRLYTTMARFDVAYHGIFQCNLKMVRHDYPRLSRWLRNLYWDTSEATNGGVFGRTTFFNAYKWGYLRAKGRQIHGGSDVGWDIILPAGPAPDIAPLTEDEKKDIEAERLEGIAMMNHVGGAAQIGNAKDLWPAEEDLEGLSEKKKLVRRTTHNEENKKWVKEIKKATKGGPPTVHLAL